LLAAREYRKILAINPKLERPRLELAYVLFKLEDYKGAKYHFKKVLATIDSKNVKENIKFFLKQIRQNLPILDITLGVVYDTNPNQETSSRKVMIGGMEFEITTASEDKTDFGYELFINSKIPIHSNDKTFIRANIEHTDFSGKNNEKTFLSTSYGKHFGANSHSSITPEIGLHKFLYKSKTLYSGKNLSLNYYNTLSNSSSFELDYKFLDYKYPNYSHMDGNKKNLTAKLSKLFTQNSVLGVQLTRVNSSSSDKTLSYKQNGIQLSSLNEFDNGWTFGVTAKINKKSHVMIDPFFGTVRKDKEKNIELTLLNSLFDFNGLSPRIRIGKTVNNSNINLYKFDSSYSKFELTKEF